MIRTSLFALALTGLIAGVLLTSACGGDDDDGSDGAGHEPTKATDSGSGSNGPKNADGQSVTGEIKLSGKLNGTFTWNPELAVTWCATARVGFTLNDGKDTFISIESAKLNDGTDQSSVGSAKASGLFVAKSVPINAKQTANFGANGSVTWSNVEMKNQAGESITVNGTLKFDCP